MTKKGYFPIKVKPTEFDSFYKNIEWIKALVDWDKGYTETLSFMVSRMHAPAELMPIIGSIVAGTRKPKRRGQSGTLYKPSEKLKIALELERWVEGSRYLSKGEGLEDLQNYIAGNGFQNDEAMRVHHNYERVAVEHRERISKKYNLSIHAALKYEKKLKELKKNWPQI